MCVYSVPLASGDSNDRLSALACRCFCSRSAEKKVKVDVSYYKSNEEDMYRHWGYVCAEMAGSNE